MRIKRRESAVGEALSSLEVEIMKMAWKEGKTTVRAVHEFLLTSGYIPYTSVMAIMNGLTSKGLLKQDRSSRTYLYKPRISREELAVKILDMVVDRVLDGNDKLLLDYLAERSGREADMGLAEEAATAKR